MHYSATTNRSTAAHLAFASLLAALFGAILGAAMSWAAPGAKFTWVGLLAAPLWLVVEFLFEAIGLLGAHSKAARLFVSIAALLGFYSVFFALQAPAP